MPQEPDALVVTTDTGDRIHYLDWGGSGSAAVLPPILLVHGLGQTAWIWAPVARRLAFHARTFALDLRGHGLSDSPRPGYELESLAFDALTVLAANGLGADVGGPPAVVAGHGLGGMVAATAASVQPASVAGVALVDGGWEDMEAATGLDASEFERMLGDPPEVLRSMEAYLADKLDYDPASWDADQERAARAAVDEKHAGHVGTVVRRHALHATVSSMFDYRPKETLLGVHAPVLIAIAEPGGADDDQARERRLAADELAGDRASARLPGTDIARFPGAGHNLMRYRPVELTAALVALLEKAAAHQRS